jgi:hypothetical protein
LAMTPGNRFVIPINSIAVLKTSSGIRFACSKLAKPTSGTGP